MRQNEYYKSNLRNAHEKINMYMRMYTFMYIFGYIAVMF